MFSEFNKVFDRNFIMGFLLPAIVMVGFSEALFPTQVRALFGVYSSASSPLSNATAFAATACILSLLLQATISPVYRLLEGYWPLRIRAPLAYFQRRAFRSLQGRCETLQVEHDRAASLGVPFEGRLARNRATEQLASRFPSTAELVLPTRFGNIVRSFEDYPRHLYGFESIHGWYRLLAVVPADYAELVAASRSNCDFWVNMGVVAALLSLVSATTLTRPAVAAQGLASPWSVSLVGALAAWLCYRQACRAAVTWGQFVKSAFEVHMPDLARRLGYQVPGDPAEARAFWRHLSVVMVYRRRDILDVQLKTYRMEEHSGGECADGE